MIRRQLALIPVYGWAVYIWGVTLGQLPVRAAGSGAITFRDFAHFYVLGFIARLKDIDALYSIPIQQSLQQQLIPSAVDTVFPPSYGPQYALLFAPLATVGYVPALLFWLAFTVVLYAACIYVVWRVLPHLRTERWPVFVLCAAAPGLHLLLLYGQNSALALVAFTLAFVAFRRERPVMAGAAIGCLFYKPQLGIAAAVLLVGAAQWRAVAGALLSMALQLGVAAAYWGHQVLALYWDALLRIPTTIANIEPTKRHMHAWRSFFQLLGFSPDAVTAWTVVASVLTLALVLPVWRATGLDWRVRFPVLVIASVLVSPHLFVYDLVVLVPVGLILWDYSSERPPNDATRVAMRLLLVLGYFGPALGFAANLLRVQLSVLAMAAMLVVLALEARRLAPPSQEVA